MRGEDDSTSNAILWYKLKRGYERFYRSGEVYTIDHNKQTTRVWLADGIKGSFWDGVLKIYFLKPEKLLKSINDTTLEITLNSIIINGIDYEKLSIRYPDEPEVTGKQRDFWIGKDDSIIKKITYKVKFQDTYQYMEWNLTDISFNQTKLKDLSDRIDSLKRVYTFFDQRTEEKKKRIPLLSNGSLAPKFSGHQFKPDKDIESEDFKGKLVVLDFWYMGCMPCIKAIPHLNDLYDKYKSEGVVVLGMNGIDKKSKMLSDFIDKRIKYPIILTDRSVNKKYQLTGYPTIYLIDRNGKILFSEVGFGEKHGLDSLEAAIKEAL